MIASLVALIIWFAGIVFTIYVLETYFPNVPRLIRAALSAFITLVVLAAVHTWLCDLFCS